MPRVSSNRTIFGPNKYAAFHLLLCRWLRHYAKPEIYRYVTLGGTELRDLQCVHFIDPNLIHRAISFEADSGRHVVAQETARQLMTNSVNVEIVKNNIFDFRRDSDQPHFFFIDLEGVCASADYYLRFAQMLQDEVLRENDTLFITSYLGRNSGWDRVFRAFDAEFRILGLSDSENKRVWYRRAHPSFTLFRALAHADLQQEVALHCVGCVEYHDSSTMALYGYVITQGTTSFGPFVKNTPYFHLKKAYT